VSLAVWKPSRQLLGHRILADAGKRRDWRRRGRLGHAVDGSTTVVDAGGATVETDGELSPSSGVLVHAASATTRATTMTLPDLIMSPFFLVVDISVAHVSPSVRRSNAHAVDGASFARRGDATNSRRPSVRIARPVPHQQHITGSHRRMIDTWEDCV